MSLKKKEMIIDKEYMWRKAIEDAAVNEDNWSVKVIVIEAACSDQERFYLSKFESYAAQEKRFVVKNICKTETVFMINQLGNDKKLKDDNFRVFEEGNFYLKNKKNIPPDVYALIIKYLILKMKEKYLFIEDQRLNVRDGMRVESAIMVDKGEFKGRASVAPASAIDLQSKGAGNKNLKKYNTSLRERGEEWRDKIYVDDYPKDGPNLYVAITGFIEPFLPECLIKIGIPLTAVVQIRIDSTNNTIPSSLNTKSGQSRKELLIDKSLTFWNILHSLRTQEETANYFKNTAFIVFSPAYYVFENLSSEPDRIYDELCYLMYDIQDLSRQHIHYLNNMDIVNIPKAQEDENLKTCYNKSINGIPLECITIYSVLDSILSTVCKNITPRDTCQSTVRSSVSEETLKNVFSLSNKKYVKSEMLVKDVFKTLCTIETNRKEYRLNYGDEYENHKNPIVIKYGDFAKRSTFHLENINLDQLVFSSLLGMPVHKLWDMQDHPSDELEAKVTFHVNVLLSCFNRKDVETSEVNRLLHILACRKLYNNRSSLTKQHLQSTTITDLKKVYFKRSIPAEPLLTSPSLTQMGISTPHFLSMTKTINEAVSNGNENNHEMQRIKYLFDCPDISELVSASEIASNRPIEHMIDEYEFFEDFAGITAFQILTQAFNKFNCVNYKYCEVTDCFVLMFFNNHDKDGIARDEWRCHLSTPICLQDFFDYTLEEHHEWIQNEEKLYDENLLLKVQSESKLESKSVLISCIDDTAVDSDLLIEGSLKHQELLQIREEFSGQAEVIDVCLESDVLQAATANKSSSRKTKSPANILPQIVRQSLGAPSSEKLAGDNRLSKPFLGYDLGDRRVEVFGKEATYYSKDGTKIQSSYTLTIPMNVEYINLNITPGNSCNEFSIHKVLGEFITPEIINYCESFRITSKDEVMINIKKRNYVTAFNQAKPSSSDNVESRISAKHRISPIALEKKHLHSLYLTWPNGLITETVYENNSSVLSHIKQYHVCQVPAIEEDMRCVSLNGEVIIFKDSGDVEVLRPDGSYIKIKKYCKRLVTFTSPEEEITDITHKRKTSRSRTGKSSKASSKSSRNFILDDEKVLNNKKLEYELVIDEFEITDTSGIRKQYVDNIPITIEKLLIRTASDYCTGEIFSRRSDGSTALINKDGIYVATFPNKTRIITYCMFDDKEIYPEWTEEEKQYLGLFKHEIKPENLKRSLSKRSFHESDSGILKRTEEEETGDKKRTDGYIVIHIIYTVEDTNYSTVTINKVTENISIESPNGTTVVIANNNDYTITLDDVTTASFDGENLKISYEACPECKAFTIANIKIMAVESSATSVDNNYWVNLKDSFNKDVVVNDEGSIIIVEESHSTCAGHHEDTSPEGPVLSDLLSEPPPYVPILQENIVPDHIEDMDVKYKTCISSQGKCRDMYLANAIRFFILRRNLNCSELIHRTLVDRYKSDCRWQPWCSVNAYKTFGDYRSLVSITTPVHRTESEKWLMESKLADKPKFLTYKDLEKDTGKGFYHWMRPYQRFVPKPIKPENVLPPRLPRAYVLRILEQQWDPADREKLKGAKELLEAILRYRNVMEKDSQTLLETRIVDQRSEKERCIDEHVQNLAHKVYQELRERLADHVRNSASVTITTKPRPQTSAEEYIETEQFSEECTTTSKEDDKEDLVKQFSQMEEMSPKLSKYWQRRAEELKEEEFNKYLLRDNNVPPYFRNVLGGAVWWEMNYAAGEAVTKSEQSKIKCACASANHAEGNEATGYGSSYMGSKTD